MTTTAHEDQFSPELGGQMNRAIYQPDDDETPDFPDDFARKWIKDNFETIKEKCQAEIQSAYEQTMQSVADDIAAERAAERRGVEI